MRFLNAGESHGKKLTGIIEGLPAGLPISKEKIDAALHQRQKGPGRGGRMKIEQDEVDLVAGVRGGYTTGAPVALEIQNRDWVNWEKIMTWEGSADLESRKVVAPRPGHADLSGALKYRTEIRNILERASARETAMRVAIGSLARQLLQELGIEIRGRVRAVGTVDVPVQEDDAYWDRVQLSEWTIGDAEAEKKAWKQLEEVRNQGDSLGGILEIQVRNVPIGLGSHVQWDRKLDGRLAQAVLSVQAIKGVSFGIGFAAGEQWGSQVHDPIEYSQQKGYSHQTNRSGGIEGGMTNGEPVIVMAAMKPIPTLYKPLDTVNIETKERVQASIERSDVCALPAALVVLEHVVAWVMAEAVLEKFPADHMEELKKAWQDYLEYLRKA